MKRLTRNGLITKVTGLGLGLKISCQGWLHKCGGNIPLGFSTIGRSRQRRNTLPLPTRARSTFGYLHLDIDLPGCQTPRLRYSASATSSSNICGKFDV